MAKQGLGGCRMILQQRSTGANGGFQTAWEWTIARLACLAIS